MVKFVIESPDLYDADEAAKILGIGYVTVWRWIRAGKLIPVKMGGRTLIPKSEIERFNKKKEQAAEA